MVVMPEFVLRQLQLAPALDVDHVGAVDEDVGRRWDLGIKRLDRPQPNHLVDDVPREAILLGLVEQQPAFVGDLAHERVDEQHQLRFCHPHRNHRVDPQENLVPDRGSRLRR